MRTSTVEQMDAVDYEDVTVSSSAVGLTASKLKNADNMPRTAVRITFEGAEMRLRHDGGTPTASVGHRVNDGDALVLFGDNNLKNFKAIRSGTVDGTMRITYYA